MQDYILTAEDIAVLEEQGLAAQIRNSSGLHLTATFLAELVANNDEKKDYALSQLAQMKEPMQLETAKIIAYVTYYEKLGALGKYRIRLKRTWAHVGLRGSNYKLWRLIHGLINRIG